MGAEKPISAYISFFILIEVELIYTVVLVSGVQHSDSVIYTDKYILFFLFLPSFLLLSFFLPFRPSLLTEGLWSSPARGQISHAVAPIPDPTLAVPSRGFEPVSQRSRDTADPFVPQQELPHIFFLRFF